MHTNVKTKQSQTNLMLFSTNPTTAVFSPHAEDFSFVSFAVAPVLSPLHGVFANTVYYARKNVTGHVTVTVGQCAPVEEVRFSELEGGNSNIMLHFKNTVIISNTSVRSNFCMGFQTE